MWCSHRGSDLIPRLCTCCMFSLFLVCFSFFCTFVLCALRVVIYSSCFSFCSSFLPRPTMLHSILFCPVLFCSVILFPVQTIIKRLEQVQKTDLLDGFPSCSAFAIVASSAIRSRSFEEHWNHSPPHARVDPHAREARIRGLHTWHHHLLCQSPKCH